MNVIDRIMLACVLAAGCVVVTMLTVAVNNIPEDRPTVPVTITPTTTIAPSPAPCVVVLDGTDTNWAARFGVHDEVRCA